MRSRCEIGGGKKDIGSGKLASHIRDITTDKYTFLFAPPLLGSSAYVSLLFFSSSDSPSGGSSSSSKVMGGSEVSDGEPGVRAGPGYSSMICRNFSIMSAWYPL
jgi:hypothetical protein